MTAPPPPACRAGSVHRQQPKGADIVDLGLVGIDPDAMFAQPGKGARQAFGLHAQMAGDQPLVIGQVDLAGALLEIGQIGQELRHALQAGMGLEPFDLVDQPLQMHEGRGQHANGEFLVSQQELAQPDTVDLQERAIGNRLGGHRIGLAAQDHRLGETAVAAHDRHHRLVSAGRHARQLDVAAQHDQHRPRDIALHEDRLALAI